MTATLLSLISIFMGIIGANIFGYIFKKEYYDVIGNTIAGVFGSILVVKLFGRLGFNAWFILENQNFYVWIFIVNCILSLLGGIIAVFILYKVKSKMQND